MVHIAEARDQPLARRGDPHGPGNRHFACVGLEDLGYRCTVFDGRPVGVSEIGDVTNQRTDVQDARRGPTFRSDRRHREEEHYAPTRAPEVHVENTLPLGGQILFLARDSGVRILFLARVSYFPDRGRPVQETESDPQVPSSRERLQ